MWWNVGTLAGNKVELTEKQTDVFEGKKEKPKKE